MRASSVSHCALCTLQYCIETVVQYIYFKPRISGSKRKRSGDVSIAGTTEEPKRFTMR